MTRNAEVSWLLRVAGRTINPEVRTLFFKEVRTLEYPAYRRRCEHWPNRTSIPPTHTGNKTGTSSFGSVCFSLLPVNHEVGLFCHFQLEFLWICKIVLLDAVMNLWKQWQTCPKIFIGCAIVSYGSLREYDRVKIKGQLLIVLLRKNLLEVWMVMLLAFLYALTFFGKRASS